MNGNLHDDAVSPDAVLAAVGPRLRGIRERRGLTLAEVSAATGVSTSTLSRLESGLRRPALDLLLPLARHYRVQLDDLVGAPGTGDPRIHPKPFRAHGMIVIPLSRGVEAAETGEGLEVFKLVLPGRERRAELTQGTHAGYEWLYVVRGSVRLALGDTELLLAEGEAAEFDTRTPHALASATAEPAELLTIVSADGRRVHFRQS